MRSVRPNPGKVLTMAAAELGTMQLERQVSMSGADPVARARALIPLLEAAGPAIEQGKELVPEVVAALLDNGFLRLLLPRSIGGRGFSPPCFPRTWRGNPPRRA